MNLAILGAGGQIGRGLALELESRHRLYLFSRDPARVSKFGIHGRSGLSVHPYSAFPDFDYDVIVNAAGPGDPRAIREHGGDIFPVTAFFDDLVLAYLASHRTALYVFLSSGAVYGNGSAGDLYVSAKQRAEARHRAAAHANIADIRIFGYFSRYIALTGGFFLSEVANAVTTGSVLTTNRTNFTRDYVGARDLARFISCLAAAGAGNGAYDLVSAAPVSKSEILNTLVRDFALQIDVRDADDGRFDPAEPFSIMINPCPSRLGYVAESTSLQTVLHEMRALAEQSSSAASH